MNYYQKKCDGITHTIRFGDTLYRLSRLYGVSVEAIMEANPDVNIYNMGVGNVLCIPMAYDQTTQIGNSTQKDIKPEEKPKDIKPTEKSETYPGEHGRRPWLNDEGTDWTVIMPYEVKTGDTLDMLLKKFDMDLDTFAAYNPKLMSALLKEGETVYVKGRRYFMFS